MATRPATCPLGPITVANSGPPPSATTARTGTTTSRRVPKVGTLIQRSTASNNRKIQALMETPPLRRKGVKTTRPTVRPRGSLDEKTRQALTKLFGEALSDLSDEDRPANTPSPPPRTQQPTPGPENQLTAATSTGPTNPPPVIISVSELNVPVPYYAVHTSRRYKARVGNRRFLLRFDRAGKLRSHREL